MTAKAAFVRSLGPAATGFSRLRVLSMARWLAHIRRAPDARAITSSESGLRAAVRVAHLGELITQYAS